MIILFLGWAVSGIISCSLMAYCLGQLTQADVTLSFILGPIGLIICLMNALADGWDRLSNWLENANNKLVWKKKEKPVLFGIEK